MIKFALYTIAISPHQVPLFEAIMETLGVANCRYIAVRPPMSERVIMGWGMACNEKWFIEESSNSGEAREILENSEVLLSGLRDWALFEKRNANGLVSIYTGERWFKPPIGIVRLLHPKYLKMAWRFARLLRRSQKVVYFPIGIHAACDMARLCGLLHGDLRCLFRAPELDFERKPGGKIWPKNEPQNTRSTRKYSLDKMRMWGYFVAPSKFPHHNSQLSTHNSQLSTQLTQSQLTTQNSLKVLWVGRLLKLKRVDIIIRAVGELSISNSNLQISLDIYGNGPEEASLKKLAARYGDVIRFYPQVPIDEVRKLMREHDVYVLASNDYEGWGAVVSEALEEGMRVIGTYEAGSSATILPKEMLFHAGDWRKLKDIVTRPASGISFGEWSAKVAGHVVVNCGEAML